MTVEVDVRADGATSIAQVMGESHAHTARLDVEEPVEQGLHAKAAALSKAIARGYLATIVVHVQVEAGSAEKRYLHPEAREVPPNEALPIRFGGCGSRVAKEGVTARLLLDKSHQCAERRLAQRAIWVRDWSQIPQVTNAGHITHQALPTLARGRTWRVVPQPP